MKPTATTMSIFIRLPLLILSVTIISSCQKSGTSKNLSEDDSKMLFTLVEPSESGIEFSNNIIESVRQNVTNYDYYYNGSGLAVGDINNDGLDDIFFAGNKELNTLYLNKGNLKFEDISETAGIQSNLWSTGVTMVDINNDGFLDIYVCNSAYSDIKDRTNKLYINNGNLTFTEQAEAYGIANSGYSSQASFFDYDKDGDLDLILMNHSVFQLLGKWLQRIRNMSLEEKYFHSPNLYKNNGDNTFTDVSQEAGILNPSFGLGLVTSDLNHDGWTDIYIANDYFLPDYYYINDKNGSFIESVKEKTGHTSFFSMGADAADFNNDGLQDIFTTSYSLAQRSRLYINNGQGGFTDQTDQRGLMGMVGGLNNIHADFNNDGLTDIFIMRGAWLGNNGQIPNSLLLNKGGCIRTAIPNEGTIMWTLGTKVTGREFKKKYKLDYKTLMQYEHVNTSDDIEKVLDYFFERSERSVYGLSKGLAFYRFYEHKNPRIELAKAYLASREKV